MTFFGGILISFVPGSASCVDCGDLSQKVATYILMQWDLTSLTWGFFLQLVFGCFWGFGAANSPGAPNSQPPDHEVLQEPLNPTLLKAAVAVVAIS